MPKFAPNLKRPVPQFYSSVIDPAELTRALEIEGIDEELAVLRIQLTKLIKERPQDLPLLLKGAELIVRTASARYRMSPKSKEDFAQTLGDTLMHFTGEFLPERFADV
jgi:hypothetical protein